MLKTSITRIALAAAATLALAGGTAGPVRADYLVLTGVASNADVYNLKYYDSKVAGNYGTAAAYVGGYQFNLYASNGGKLLGSFDGYCTDLFDDINIGEGWNVNAESVTATNTTALANVVNTYPLYAKDTSAELQDIVEIAASNPEPPTTPSAQLAMWDLVENGTVTISNGNATWASVAGPGGSSLFSASPYYGSTNFQGNPTSLGPSANNYADYLFVPASGTPGDGSRPQDIITSTQGLGFSIPIAPVPEPPYIQCITLAGLSGIGLIRRRLRSRAS